MKSGAGFDWNSLLLAHLNMHMHNLKLLDFFFPFLSLRQHEKPDEDKISKMQEKGHTIVIFTAFISIHLGFKNVDINQEDI